MFKRVNLIVYESDLNLITVWLFVFQGTSSQHRAHSNEDKFSPISLSTTLDQTIREAHTNTRRSTRSSFLTPTHRPIFQTSTPLSQPQKRKSETMRTSVNSTTTHPTSVTHTHPRSTHPTSLNSTTKHPTSVKPSNPRSKQPTSVKPNNPRSKYPTSLRPTYSSSMTCVLPANTSCSTGMPVYGKY